MTGSHFFPVPLWDSHTLASLETRPSGGSPRVQEQESHSQNSSASWEKKDKKEDGVSKKRRISATSKTLATILKPFHSAKSKHTLRYFSASAYNPNSADELFDISPMLLSQTALLRLLWRLVSLPLDSGPKTWESLEYLGIEPNLGERWRVHLFLWRVRDS